MGCCGGFIGQVFNPVVETVVNPIVEPIIEQVVQPVVKAVEQTVQAALANPLQTAAIATAMATGQTYLIPYINAGFALDAGQSPEKALQSAAISYAGAQVGGAVGAETGSALAGNVAGGTTSGLLSGKPLEQSLAGGLTSGAISQVTPSGLLSSGGTSGTTPTQDYVPELNIGQGTTGATNMADYFTNDYENYGSQNMYTNPYSAVGADNAYLANTQMYNNPYDALSADNAYMATQALTPEQLAQVGMGAPTSYLSSLDAATQAIIKRALAAGGSAAQGAMNFLNQKGVVQGGLQTAGGLLQMQQSRDAALQAQRNIQQAAGQGVAGAQFRPVGTTTRFGTSNFQVDPNTGQLVSAGYTAAPEITSAQNRLLGLGASYLAQTPEEVAQQ